MSNLLFKLFFRKQKKDMDSLKAEVRASQKQLSEFRELMQRIYSNVNFSDPEFDVYTLRLLRGFEGAYHRAFEKSGLELSTKIAIEATSEEVLDFLSEHPAREVRRAVLDNEHSTEDIKKAARASTNYEKASDRFLMANPYAERYVGKVPAQETSIFLD